MGSNPTLSAISPPEIVWFRGDFLAFMPLSAAFGTSRVSGEDEACRAYVERFADYGARDAKAGVAVARAVLG